ncbi:MAG TPA: hypothetical protein VM597_22070 [Gemmataceae bacterium]|nr:hypothetical protein [Gemmataceae bacterium]
MTSDSPEAVRRRVRQLRAAVYARPDPAADPALLAELARAEAALHAIPAPPVAPAATPEATPAGRLLGPDTTRLKVETVVRLNPVPTAIYPLLDPDTDPLVTVTVTNTSLDATARRVRVKAYVEGLSAEAVRTVEVKKKNSSPPINLLPLLFPERARLLTTVQRATLHVQVDDLDGKPESHDTYPLVFLARSSGFNAARDPKTGEPKDLTHYYAAWVTPFAEPVQQVIRRAAALHPKGLLGDGDPRAQAAALYAALRACDLAYVNSVTDYGGGPGQATQRARLPREALELKSANCVDGAVLFASLLEGASLSPALLLIPGHALVGWETLDGYGDWQFLETTMLATADFEAACRSGQAQYEAAAAHYPDRVRLHRLADLRARGIWPME